MVWECFGVNPRCVCVHAYFIMMKGYATLAGSAGEWYEGDVLQAIEAVGLRGREGVLVKDLWTDVPELDGDDDAQAAAWMQVRACEDVAFRRDAAAESAAVGAAELGAMSVVDAATLHATASERLRAYVFGFREDPMFDPQSNVRTNEDSMRVVEAVARAGPVGVLQNELTRALGVPASQLAYSFARLEDMHILHRETVHIAE